MVEKLTSLLGETFKSKSGNVNLTDIISNPDTEAIGLYFSAHWCGPCRSFTPKLVTFYNDLNKDRKRFEIIFVSSDKDNGSFEHYYETMPWLAIGFDNKALVQKLKSNFNIQGIPSLILVGKDGNTLTKSGRECVDRNPEGFPWPPKNFWQIVEGGDLKRNNGENVSIESLKDKDAIGIYFSAHWCPPCKAFTPVLASVYNTLRENGRNFELIFASADHDLSSYNQYFGTMPWVAFPLNDPRVSDLNVKFEVSGIPRLVILDKNGNVINNNARTRVEQDKSGQQFPWHPPVVEDLNTISGSVINDEKCFIVADPNLNEDTLGLLRVVATEYLEKWKPSGSKPFNFVFARDGPILNRLKQFLNLGSEYPYILVLDIPSQSKFVVKKEVNEQNLRDLCEDIIASRVSFVGLKD